MRHLWSLIAGVVVAPLAWALLAMGQAGTSATITAWTGDNAFDTADLIQPAAYLVAAGVLLGLVATLRISPLGALVAGLAYLGLNVGLFIDPFSVTDAVPNNWKPFGETIPLRGPLVNGTLAAIGALLVVAAFSAKRWRQWPTAAPVAVPGEEPVVTEGEEPTVVEQPTPSDQPTAVIPPPPSMYPPVSPATVPDSEAATEPVPRHAAESDSIPPPPPEPYTEDSPSSPWAAPPPRQSDRE
jgi:hypothetical protein